MSDPRTAETIAKYHDEHAGYGGASFEFHARAATFIRSSALEYQRLTALATASEEAARMYSERSQRWEEECHRLTAEHNRMEARIRKAENLLLYWSATFPDAALDRVLKAYSAKYTTPTEEPTR